MCNVYFNLLPKKPLGYVKRFFSFISKRKFRGKTGGCTSCGQSATNLLAKGIHIYLYRWKRFCNCHHMMMRYSIHALALVEWTLSRSWVKRRCCESGAGSLHLGKGWRGKNMFDLIKLAVCICRHAHLDVMACLLRIIHALLKIQAAHGCKKNNFARPLSSFTKKQVSLHLVFEAWVPEFEKQHFASFWELDFWFFVVLSHQIRFWGLDVFI